MANSSAKRAIGWAMAAIAVIAGAASPPDMKKALGQKAGTVATPAKAAKVWVVPPLKAGSGTFLDIGVRAYTPPHRGAVEAVVVVRPGGDGPGQEVGRFSIFPDEPFGTADSRQERTYRLDATAALTALGHTNGRIEVEVRLVPLDPGVSSIDATLTVGQVAFRPRQ